MENVRRPTKKQQELLEFVENFIAEHDYGPSYREVMRGLGYKSVSTVAVHVDGLIASGRLKKGGSGSVRSLEIVSNSNANASSDSAAKAKTAADEIEAAYKKATNKQKATLIETLKILGYDENAATLEKNQESAT